MNKYRIAVLIAVISGVSGCSAPGKEANKTSNEIAEHISKRLLNNSLTNNVDSSVYQEMDQGLILGEPYRREEVKAIPDYMKAPLRLTDHRVKSLGEVVDYLNNEYSRYGLNISFTTDAINYINSGSSNKGQTGASGNADSTGEGLDFTSVYNNNTAANLVSGSGIRLSLPHSGETNLKNVLDRIASTTNLWWEVSHSGRVNFYRQKTKSIPVDLFNSKTGMSTNIGSATSGGGDGENTSSNTSSSSSYTLGKDLGDAGEQLLSALNAIKSEDGKLELIPTLGLVVVTDTPDKLRTIESFVNHANKVATRMIRLNVELWEVVTTDQTNLGIEQAVKYGSDSTELNFNGISLDGSTSLGGFAYKSTSGSFRNTELAIRALQGTQSLNLKRRWETTIANNGTRPIQYVKERAYASKLGSTTNGETIQQSLETATTTNGMVLYASPRINSDGTIQLELVSSLSTLDSLDQISVENTQVMLPERTVSSFVSSRNMRDGDSVIMNGFEQESDSAENRSILGKLWWWLGGNDTREKQRSMMLIMVTAHIERV